MQRIDLQYNRRQNDADEQTSDEQDDGLSLRLIFPEVVDGKRVLVVGSIRPSLLSLVICDRRTLLSSVTAVSLTAGP